MSPADYYGGAGVFSVTSNGQIGYPNVNTALGVRPAINLRADVQLSGSGTSDDPYVVEGAE